MENQNDCEFTTVTGEQFDRDPRAVYERASRIGPVTVLDAQGRPSMTVVVALPVSRAAGE